ncbi:DUF6400 family protein [Streptomyces sp. NPDC059627]
MPPPSSSSRPPRAAPRTCGNSARRSRRSRSSRSAGWGGPRARAPPPHGWDPVEMVRGEEEAYDMLYSGLDPEQQRLYDTLVAAGVLPRRGDGGGNGGNGAGEAV